MGGDIFGTAGELAEKTPFSNLTDDTLALCSHFHDLTTSSSGSVTTEALDKIANKTKDIIAYFPGLRGSIYSNGNRDLIDSFETQVGVLKGTVQTILDNLDRYVRNPGNTYNELCYYLVQLKDLIEY